MSNSFVIGGGWSVSLCAPFIDDLVSLGHVIGVNESSILTDVHEAITMDRLWFEHRWSTLCDLGVKKVWVREKCDCNVPDSTALRFRHFNLPEPSVEPGILHGGNSGTCGINLAFQRMMSGDNLFLLGFDMCKGPDDQPYWHKPYSWASPEGATKPGHFKQWTHDLAGFARYAKAKQFNVYNVSMRSRIELWPKLSPDQMLGMIHGF